MKKGLIIVAAVVAISVGGIVALKGNHMKERADVASVERDIQEHLPIGSSRAEVSAFLDQRKITHSHVGHEPAAPESSNTEMAMIRGVSQKGVVRGDIQILLKFDAADSKLVSYTVKEIFTGP
jgi:hypothetical protein